MSYSSLVVFFLSCIFISLCLITTAQICDNNKGNFTANSTFSKNRNLILSSLASNATANGGFYTGTIGQDSDMVYALALCRGDLSSKKCFDCINSPSQEIMKNCPNQKEAVHWPAEDPRCIVRCSNRSIFGIMEASPGWNVWNLADITTNVDEFDQAFNSLIDSLLVRAAWGGSSRLKSATGEKNFMEYQNIYALLQCTPQGRSQEFGSGEQTLFLILLHIPVMQVINRILIFILLLIQLSH
uniref:Gnk2-homologous domain-containing protein n=1 Tax=Davidia involucrata TaxID=16924 RepID=A0A5B7BGZ4_DAVIN